MERALWPFPFSFKERITAGPHGLEDEYLLGLLNTLVCASMVNIILQAGRRLCLSIS
jgi:hypothetical protein